MFKYPFAVIRHARQKYVARLRDARQHMIAFVTQTAVFLVILYFLPIAEDVREEARLVLAGVASLFLSLGFSFVLDLLRSPGQLWADLTERVAKLEQRLTPILAAVPYNGGMPALWMAHYERGIMPGSLAASAPEHDRYLAIEFWNRTDADLQNIRAHLIDLQRDDGSATVFNRPIDLQWLVLGDVPETLVEIPPGARRKLIVANSTDKGVILHTRNALPGPYNRIFQRGGNFIGRIVLLPWMGGGTLVDFRIVQEGPNAPRIEVISTPKAVDTAEALKMEMTP